MSEATTTAVESTAQPTMEEVAAEVFGTPADDETTEVAAEGEASEEAKKPDEAKERVGARIAAAKGAELKAARSREVLRTERAQIEAHARQLAAREAKIRLIEEDPVRFFEETKADPKAFLVKLAGKNSPEEKSKAVEKKIDAVAAELEKERNERIRLQQEARLRELDSTSRVAADQASQAFVAHVTEHAERFPHLVEEYTDRDAVQAAWSVLTEIVGQDRAGKPVTRSEAYRAKYGEYPDDDVIAEYLDQQAKARIEARQKSPWRRGNGKTGATSPPANRGPHTLTSRSASQRGSGPKPWSQEDADEESLRILRAAFK